MKLPGIKQPDRQIWMWERPLGNHGHVRTTLGDFAETLTAELFGGVRYKTDSRILYCPDIGVGNTFLECKTLGKSKQTFIYEGRLRKDYNFAQEHNLIYCVWVHNLKTKDCETMEELKREFLRHLICLYFVPFERMYEMAMECKVSKLNSNYGHSDTNPTYGAGYRIPVKKIEEGIRYRMEWDYVSNDVYLPGLWRSV